MIKWLSPLELEALLASFSPTGLELRSFLHARTAVDLATWFERTSIAVPEDGLGETHHWCGIVDGMPFEIAGSPRRLGWGFEVRLPQCRGGDKAIMLALQEIRLPTISDPYFESLPIEGGYVVAAAVATDAVVYRTEVLEDAEAAVALLRALSDDVFVARADPRPTAGWVVTGPAVGPYVSHVSVEQDEASARLEAARLTALTGYEFAATRTLCAD